MFDVRSFEAKNRVFEFDYQQMNTFEFVRCSKNDVRVRLMFDKMVFDPSLLFYHNHKLVKLIMAAPCSFLEIAHLLVNSMLLGLLLMSLWKCNPCQSTTTPQARRTLSNSLKSLAVGIQTMLWTINIQCCQLCNPIQNV